MNIPKHITLRNMDDYDWHDAIEDARDHGVPYALFETHMTK